MIQSLYRIGKVLQKKYPEYYQPWKNPFPGQEDTAIIVVVEVENGAIKYPLSLEKYKSNFEKKYLYRKINGARGTNVVPTLFLHVEEKEESQRNNIRKTLVKVKASLKNYKHTFLKGDDIDDKLAEEIYKLDLNKNNRHLLTFRVNGKWAGEIAENVEKFEAEAYNKYSDKSAAKEHLCAVTNEVTNVWGRIDTLGFTVNDKTFNRNGFDGKQSYKMFPVSPEAVKILEGTKNYVLENYSQGFYGMKFFILPHFIDVSDEGIKDALEEFKTKHNNPLAKDKKYSIIGNERILHEIAEDEKLSQSNIYYDIFFYQPNNAQFLIKLHLSDVLPSQLSRIFNIKRNVEKFYYPLTHRVIKDEPIDFHISFGEIKNYFAKKVRTDWVFAPFFFKILESVFYGNKLNEKKLKKGLLDEIRQQFKQHKENKYKWIQRTYEAFTLWHFFSQLNLLNTKSTIDMTTQELALNAFDFVEQHNDFFANDHFLKGLFFLGCATEKLLEKQRKKFKQEPFFNNLNGLVISHRNARKIFNSLNRKVHEYKRESNDEYKFYANEIKYIEQLLIQADEQLIGTTNASIDDQSFAFISGLNMQKKFTNHLIKERKEAKDAAENENQ